MADNINFVLPYLVLLSHGILVVLFLAVIFRHSWGWNIQAWVGKHAVLFAALVSLVAIGGSLFYSEIIGFEPCTLCWWQRVFLFPLAVIFSVALWKKTSSAFLYAVPFTLAAALIAAYQSYVYLGGVSLLSCTAAEGACSKIYVMAFGYISIPVMSLTVSLFILLFAWINKVYRNDNRNA